MLWNQHKDYEGKHAFLGASQWRWTTWDDATLEDRYYSQYAQQAGTILHALAHDCICSNMKLNKSDKHLIDMYMYKNFIPRNAYDTDFFLDNLLPFVNDAIGFHMSSEVLLFYSPNCFGTADAIMYYEKDKTLRIHDLKSGTQAAHPEQLMIYAALFYLEYKKKPTENKTLLRIYQNCEIIEYEPDPMEIEKLMKLIQNRDNYLQLMKGVSVK